MSTNLTIQQRAGLRKFNLDMTSSQLRQAFLNGMEWAESHPIDPVGDELTDAQIRKILMENGFTAKDGGWDLKDYVYKAVRAVLEAEKQRARKA